MLVNQEKALKSADCRFSEALWKLLLVKITLIVKASLTHLNVEPWMR